MKLKKKFYVGSRTMKDQENGWGHTTLNGALEHAKQLAQEQEEDQIVVQIVRVVRRQKVPLIVEKVE